MKDSAESWTATGYDNGSTGSDVDVDRTSNLPTTWNVEPETILYGRGQCWEDYFIAVGKHTIGSPLFWETSCLSSSECPRMFRYPINVKISRHGRHIVEGLRERPTLYSAAVRRLQHMVSEADSREENAILLLCHLRQVRDVARRWVNWSYNNKYDPLRVIVEK